MVAEEMKKYLTSSTVEYRTIGTEKKRREEDNSDFQVAFIELEVEDCYDCWDIGEIMLLVYFSLVQSATKIVGQNSRIVEYKVLENI